MEYELPLQFTITSPEFDVKRSEYVFTGTTFQKTVVERTARWRTRPFQRGGLRQVHSMLDGLCRRVAKFPRSSDAAADGPAVFAQQTAIASYFAKEFCAAVGLNADRFQYTPCYEYHAQRWNQDDSTEKCIFAGEDVLVGMFVKWNSNEGYVNTVDGSCEAQAFSHFSYEASCHKLMVVDVQGIRDGSHYILTDPQVLTIEQRFGRGDLGTSGMEAFLESHTCNYLCEKWRKWRDSATARSEGGDRSSLSFTGQISLGPVVETGDAANETRAVTQPQPKRKAWSIEGMLRRQSRQPRPKAVVGRKKRKQGSAGVRD